MVCSWNCNSRHDCAYVCVCVVTAFFYVCLLALSMRRHRRACGDGSLAWWARLHFETQNWGRGVDKNAEFAHKETKPKLKVLFWCRSGLLIIGRNFPPLLLGVEPVSYTKKTLLIRRPKQFRPLKKTFHSFSSCWWREMSVLVEAAAPLFFQFSSTVLAYIPPFCAFSTQAVCVNELTASNLVTFHRKPVSGFRI